MYISEGWLLVILSSLTTLLGCLVISLDVVYSKLMPGYSKTHPFTISDNSAFLINSLALSGGCLIFTSMYKLLPSGQDYFSSVPQLVEGKHALMAHVMGFYLLGILLSAGLNTLVHFLTSESIVHCVHGDRHHHGRSSHSENGHIHHDHDVFQDREPGLGGSQSESHSHSHSEPHSPSQPNSHDHSNTQSHSHLHSHSHSHSDSHNHLEVLSPLSESTPLIPDALERRESIFDRSLRALRGSKLAGKCYGYNSIESCQLPNGVCTCQHHFQEDIHAIHDDVGSANVETTTKAILHYTELPQSENHLFFNASKLIRTSSEISIIHPNMTVKSPLIRSDPPISEGECSCDHGSSSSSPDETIYKGNETEGDEEEDHHHHITSPMSRLLSIGLQTVLALTLHKFPEGFIVYSTSNADEQTGLSIFLSMFIHNFVEGFTMALPLYVALNSRVKAILIVGLLGGLAQPIGALCSYLIFRGKDLDLSDPKNLMVFGSLMCVTAGFLTIIGFQMLSSSIAFGGSQSKVLTWACLGISLIGFSYVLMSGE